MCNMSNDASSEHFSLVMAQKWIQKMLTGQWRIHSSADWQTKFLVSAPSDCCLINHCRSKRTSTFVTVHGSESGAQNEFSR